MWFDRAPCNYGGAREWFRCRHDGKREPVLYGVGARFLFRHRYTLSDGSGMARATRQGPMMVYGMDFTSAPRRAKPITRACCLLDGSALTVEGFEDLVSFDAFERALTQPGRWVAGIDFPFGQSRKLVTNMGWPGAWSDYVGLVAGMTRDQFVETLEAYKARRPAGDKEHRRRTDQQAGAISPQKLYGVPVGKMFFEGARRLLRSPASIVPVRPTPDQRVVVEAYPALVARRWVGRDGYKSDMRSKQTDAQRATRERIVAGLASRQCRQTYGIELVCTDQHRARMIDDATGDQLDALLCAVQAAWAWSQRDQGYGVPQDADVLEGWIVDPVLLPA